MALRSPCHAFAVRRRTDFSEVWLSSCAQNQRLLYGLKKQHVVELLRPGGVDAEQQALGWRPCSA